MNDVKNKNQSNHNIEQDFSLTKIKGEEFIQKNKIIKFTFFLSKFKYKKHFN